MLHNRQLALQKWANDHGQSLSKLARSASIPLPTLLLCLRRGSMNTEHRAALLGIGVPANMLPGDLRTKPELLKRIEEQEAEIQSLKSRLARYESAA